MPYIILQYTVTLGGADGVNGSLQSDQKPLHTKVFLKSFSPSAENFLNNILHACLGSYLR